VETGPPGQPVLLGMFLFFFPESDLDHRGLNFDDYRSFRHQILKMKSNNNHLGPNSPPRLRPTGQNMSPWGWLAASTGEHCGTAEGPGNGLCKAPRGAAARGSPRRPGWTTRQIVSAQGAPRKAKIHYFPRWPDHAVRIFNVCSPKMFFSGGIVQTCPCEPFPQGNMIHEQFPLISIL